MTNALIWLAIGSIILVAGSRWMQRARRTIPAMRVLGGGWALLAFGILVGPHALGVFDGGRLVQVQPILLILLTWAGIVIGLQCRVRLFRAIPPALWRWVSFDLCVSLVFAIVAGGVVARMWQPDSPAAAHILLTGTFAALAIGWNPESRSLSRRNDARALRMAALVQAGAGVLAVCTVVIASLALQCAFQDSYGNVIFAPWGGMLALAMEVGAVCVVALGAREILRDTREDDARTTLIVIGALCILSGIAVSFGGSGLLTGLIFGATIGLSRRRLRALEHFISSAEPIVASGCFFFAGMTLALPEASGTLLGALAVGAIVLMLALARRVLKPLLMTLALAPDRATVALDSGAARAPARQAPLTIVVLLAFAIQDTSGLAEQLLAFAVLISLASVAFTLLPRIDDNATAPRGALP